MTTTTAELCGHRWLADHRPPGDRVVHRCDGRVDHAAPCRCRCGATTTRKDADHA